MALTEAVEVRAWSSVEVAEQHDSARRACGCWLLLVVLVLVLVLVLAAGLPFGGAQLLHAGLERAVYGERRDTRARARSDGRV